MADGEELVWHRDRQTRTVKVLDGHRSMEDMQT